MIKKIDEVLDIQKYLIGGFIDYGYASDYKDTIPSKLFGSYEPLFIFLCENGNARTPEFYEVSKKIGNNLMIEAMERSDHSFIGQRDKYIRRLFDWYIANVMMKEKTPAEVLDIVNDIYIKLEYIRTQTDGGISKIDNLLFKLQDDIEEAVQYGDGKPGYLTGISTIDKYTGGLVKGRTMRVSAYSNTGKSALSYQITNSALRQGAKVLYFSLEIPKEDLRNRLLSNYYSIPIGKFDKKSSLSEFDMSEYATRELYISSESFGIGEIEKITKSVKPDVIVIDYVQLIKGDGNTEYEQMNDVARRIRKISAENDVAVFDLSQVSNEGKDYKKGSVIPSKGSGELVAAANTVFVMTESKFPGKINLYLAKNRHGEKGKCIELVPDFRTSTFTDNGEIDPETKSF